MSCTKGRTSLKLSTLCTSSQISIMQLRCLSSHASRVSALFRLHYLGHLAESRFSF